MTNDLPEPIGAIWVRGFKFRERLKKFLDEKKVSYEDGELDEVFLASHTLSVKISDRKEKFIAIENGKKRGRPCKCYWQNGSFHQCRNCAKPDYFIHLYQAYTGANPEYPFGAKRSRGDGKASQGRTTIQGVEDAKDRTPGMAHGTGDVREDRIAVSSDTPDNSREDVKRTVEDITTQGEEPNGKTKEA